MHPRDFSIIFAQTWEAVATLANVKSGEYAAQADTDRLGNFKDAGKRQSLIPEKVLMVYLDKHYAAISNFVEDLAKGKDRPRSESITGRVDDMILYGILFKCLLAERGELQDAMNEEEDPPEIKFTPPTLRWDDEEEGNA